MNIFFLSSSHSRYPRTYYREGFIAGIIAMAFEFKQLAIMQYGVGLPELI